MKCPESKQLPGIETVCSQLWGFLLGSWKCFGISLDGCTKLLNHAFFHMNFTLCEFFSSRKKTSWKTILK